jgi:hypothetical protein
MESFYSIFGNDVDQTTEVRVALLLRKGYS